MAVRNNLRAWRDQAGMSREQLAEKLDISDVSIFRIEKGQQQPRPALLEAITNTFGKSPSQFYVDAEEGWDGADRSSIPLIGMDELSAEPPAKRNRRQRTLDEFAPPDGTFAIAIEDRSMEPVFRRGDLVVIDPAVGPQPEDFVVATDEHGETVFRQFHDRGMKGARERVFELVALNPAYPTWRSDQQRITTKGTMIEHRRFRSSPVSRLSQK